MTNFWVTELTIWKFFFCLSFHFLHSYQSVVSEHHFNLLQKCLWRNLSPQQLQKNGAFCKSDKGFVTVCVTFAHAHTLTHTHTHTICHGTFAATTSRKYEPISPDKTYTSKGWAAQWCLGRHRLRYMTKTKNHDSLAWEKHSIEARPASPHQFLLLRQARCVLLSLVFESSCRVINGSGQTGADEGQPDE